jgi:zinc transport system permease protein
MSVLLDDFLVRAALAGIGIALLAGPLGCFVVWRRMAYFGDTLAHAALLGVALALVLHIGIIPGVLAVALAVALAIARGSGRRYAADTLLGVLAHGGLAVGLVVLSFVPGARTDLSAWLFGDILAVSARDVGPLARTPEAMAALAALIGAASVLGGLRLAWVADSPAGPSVVVAALALFLLSNVASRA